MATRLALALLALLACRPTSRGEAPPAGERDFWTRREAHLTEVDPKGPSTRAGDPVEDPVGAERHTYREDPDLWGWLGRPQASSSAPAPALVYFHGDFSIDAYDYEVLASFREAGFVTFSPILRGENGSEGEFTLLHDELDDAVAAVRWVAARPEVDPQRIYTFGHSVGGGLAALTSLVPELPLRVTGSSGGIYVPETFVRWSKLESQRALIRFDPTQREELELRCLGPNLASMLRPHIAYVGDEDRWFHANVRELQSEADRLAAPFTHHFVPGDHGSALAPSLEAFAAHIQAN